MAKLTKMAPPNLENATDAHIVDEMGKLSMIENYAKKMRAYYKEALYKRRGIDPNGVVETTQTIGEMFIANTSQSPVFRVDQDKVKAVEDWRDLYGKDSTVTTTRFELKEGVVNPIINDLINTLKAELDLD